MKVKLKSNKYNTVGEHLFLWYKEKKYNWTYSGLFPRRAVDGDSSPIFGLIKGGRFVVFFFSCPGLINGLSGFSAKYNDVIQILVEYSSYVIYDFSHAFVV